MQHEGKLKMLYTSRTPDPGMGRSKNWRIYAEPGTDLEQAIKAVGGKLYLASPGDPGEHAVVPTAVKNKLRVKEVDDKDIIRLIKSKQFPEPVVEDFGEPEDTGRITFSTKPDESDDEADQAE